MQVVDCQSEVDCTMPQATNSHDCKKNFEMTFSQNKLFPFTKMTSIISTLHSLQAYDIFFSISATHVLNGKGTYGNSSNQEKLILPKLSLTIERATTKDMPLAECETCCALRRFKGRLCKWWEFKKHKPPLALKTQKMPSVLQVLPLYEMYRRQ